jgi:hypothetical protein
MPLMSTGSRAAKFNTPGDTITGTICSEVRETQANDFTTGQPAFWPNGNPKLQWLVDLQTDTRDDDDDDGIRTLYISSPRLRTAVVDAVTKAKAAEPERGGRLTVTYTGTPPDAKNPLAKGYTATYEKPTSGLAATPPPPAAQQQQAAQHSLNGDVEGKVRQLINLGLDDDKIAAALANFGVDAPIVAALR